MALITYTIFLDVLGEKVRNACAAYFTMFDLLVDLGPLRVPWWSHTPRVPLMVSSDRPIRRARPRPRQVEETLREKSGAEEREVIACPKKRAWATGLALWKRFQAEVTTLGFMAFTVYALTRVHEPMNPHFAWHEPGRVSWPNGVWLTCRGAAASLFPPAPFAPALRRARRLVSP